MNLKQYLIRVLALIALITVAACASPQSGGIFESTSPPDQEVTPAEPPETQPEGITWECDPVGFPGQFPAKPPVNIDGLPWPDGLGEFPINRDRAIGFAFRDGHMPLIAAPAGARCLVKYNGQEYGIGLGLVWVVDDASSIQSNLVVAKPGTGDGYLVSSLDQEPGYVPLATALLRQQADVPVPIDATLRSYTTCFSAQADYQQWYTHCLDHPDYSVSAQFTQAYEGQVVAEANKSFQTLLQHELVPSEADMLWSFSISEVEDPADLEGCKPEQPGSCPADIVITPADRETAPVLGKPAAGLQSGEFVGILNLSQVLDLSDMSPSVILQPGDYAFYLVGQEVETVGVLWETGEKVGPFFVPATLAPLVDETGPESAIEVDSCRLFTICLFRECR